MTEKIEYRGFTIVSDHEAEKWTNASAVKFWEHQNDDSTKFADNPTGAKLDIDNIIIERQAKQIERLKFSLQMSNATLKGIKNALGNMVSFSVLEEQLRENEITLNHLES